MSEPMGEPALRRLTPDDWAVLRDVRLRALADSPDAFGSTLEREQPFDEKEWRRRSVRPVWVAEVDGRPVAMAGAFTNDGVLQVWGMWTDPDHRGQGVARLLDLAFNLVRIAGHVSSSRSPGCCHGRALAGVERTDREPCPASQGTLHRVIGAHATLGPVGAVAQLAEALGLGPSQCGFESHRPHHARRRGSSTRRNNSVPLSR